MKKLLIIFAALTLTLTLAGCGKDTELKKIPAEVTMTEVDEYLGRPDVQYVDLRNFDDKMNAGYISGFEFLPFFDYLEYENILVRTDGDWTFAAEDIKNANALKALFDAEKTIFLMCGSGTRAGYVKAALESLNYTNVINVGGIGTYLEGDAVNAVAGDDSYTINMDKQGAFTPGTYFGYDPVGGYMTTVMVGPKGGITSVVFDAVYGDSTKQDMGDAYMLASGTSWADEADELAAYIVANQGWGSIVLDETSLTGLNASTVGHHFIDIDHTVVIDAIAGVTIGAEGFVLSWNAAIAQASTTDLGVVAIDATPAEWAAAHAPAFAYTDGVYFGADTMGGYNVKITVEGGFIVDVFFDATYGDSTKQVMGDGYMLASGTSWADEANELAAYIVANQGWGDIVLDEMDLTGVNGLTVGHHYIDIDHTVVIDDIAGVTIGVEGFVLAWNDAIVKASTVDQGLVPVVADAEAWAKAHENAFMYTDGMYYGYDEATNYFVKVTVADGFIVEILFDAVYGDSDANTATTKQTLGYDYMLASGFTWASEADALAAAIMDAQEWSADWTIIAGANPGDHDKFDATAQGVIDDVAGVTIGIEGFKAAFEEAMSMIPTEIFFSEYIEGSSNNKAIEIANPTDFDMLLDGYVINYYNNGSATVTKSFDLTGITILAGDVYVICTDTYAGPAICDEIQSYGDADAVVFFNGDDAMELMKATVAIDVIGLVGQEGDDVDNKFWTVGDGTTQNFTLVRSPGVYGPNGVFTTSEWVVYPEDTFDMLGSH